MKKQIDARTEDPSTPAAPVSHRARWTAIGAAVAVVLGAGGLMTATAVGNNGTRSVFVAITPCRVMDTRPAPQTVGPRATPIGGGETHTIAITGTNGNCTVPADATGVSLNVTATNPSADSFITVFPADAPRPVASSLNFVGAQPPVPNAVTVDLSADGKVSFYNNTGTVDVLADIVGYYLDENHNHDDRYYTKGEIDSGFYTKTDVNAHEAAQKFISINVFGTNTEATAVPDGRFGIKLTDAGTFPSIVNFTAPPDMTPNTPMTLRVTYTIAQTNCTVSLAPAGIWVSRQGEAAVPVPIAPAPLPGLVAIGGDPRPAPVPLGAASTALYTLGLPANGAGLRAGDAVTVAIQRKGAVDTCVESLFITGIEVDYT
jgi:hypothetical protein